MRELGSLGAQCEEAAHSVRGLGSVCGNWTKCEGDGLSVRELETV